MPSSAGVEVLLTASPGLLENGGGSKQTAAPCAHSCEPSGSSAFSGRVPANPAITTRAGLYLGLRYGLGVLVSIGNMFLLTWWIGPHAYGIFITSIGLTAFLASLARSGVDTYLVRRALPPDEPMFAVANALVGSLSLVLMLAGAAAMPLLAKWYGNREFVPAYTVLLFTIPLVGLTGPPTAKLERDLNFRTVAQIELGGQVLALLVSITLAWRGLGVWAPVLGHLSWQIFGACAAFSASKMIPRFQFNRQCAREMLTFGVGYTASLRTWQLRTLVNPLLVGRFAGVEGVAFVGLAIRIAEGLGFIRIAAARLAIAALARLQDDTARFRAALQNALKLQLVVLGPLLCAFALVGPFVVARFMGIRWTPSLRVYPFIAAGVLINSVFNLQASALFVVGRQWLVLKSYATHVALLILGTWFLMPRLGIAGYGWADLTACLGYWFLSSSPLPAIAISYRRLAPWVLAFAAPLFTPFTHSLWGLALCLPLCVIVAGESCRLVPGSQLATEHAPTTRFSETISAGFVHLATFLLKARQRGWPYIYSVLRYQTRSGSFYWRQTIRRSLRKLGIASPAQSPSRRPSGPTTREVSASFQNFHFEAENISGIVASLPESVRNRTLEEAQRTLSQHFSFRGRDFTFPRDIDWQAHPGGNISWQWDLNRHRYFLTLGTAYYYSRRSEYLDKLVALWEHWLAANPAGKTPAWQQPFEVASRLRNWIWAYFLLERSGQFSPQRLNRFEAAIRDHGLALNASLEYHWPNNHLLLEAKTLYEYALLFPQLNSEKKIAPRARRVVVREIERQILPDGGHSELCSMYHRIVAGELVQLAILCRRLGTPLPPSIEDRIKKAVEFSHALEHDDGNTPLLGDSAADDTNLRFDFARSKACELVYWIKPEAVADFLVTAQHTQPRNLQIFPDSGYAFFRGGTGRRAFHLTFDFGAFSRCCSANHAHADALSFDLNAGGRPLLVDPGVYFPWDDDGSWARHFRGTAAHNTLVIDGKDQSEFCRFTNVGRRAAQKLLDHRASDSHLQVTAECVPFWADQSGICHIRTITVDNNGQIFIRDHVAGSGRHRLDWYFHAAPDLEAIATSAAQFALRCPQSERPLAVVRTQSPSAPNLKLLRGQTEPRQGWVSLNSAQIMPSYVGIFSVEVNLPFAIDFEIELFN